MTFTVLTGLSDQHLRVSVYYGGGDYIKIIIEQSNVQKGYTVTNLMTYNLLILENEQTSSYSLLVRDVKHQDVPNAIRTLLGNVIEVIPSKK